MINKKRKKIFLLLIITVFSFITNINIVKAASVGGYSETPDDYTPTGKCPPTQAGSLDCPGDGSWTATCAKGTATGNGNEMTADMWDLNGNYIAETFDFESNLKGNILAGTYVTLNIYEEKWYWKRVNIYSTGIQEYHDCYKEWTEWECEDTNGDGKEDKCGWKTHSDTIEHQPGTVATACPEDYHSIKQEFECTSTCEQALRACKAKHKPTREELSPSFEVYYPNSNDIDSDEPPKKVEAEFEFLISNDHDGEWYWYISDRKRFSYNIGKSCINVKTSKVRYIDDDEQCNLELENEYTIKQEFGKKIGKLCINLKTSKVRYIEDNEECNLELEKEYTISKESGKSKYFIPLNANSAGDIRVSAIPIQDDTRKISGATCQSIINNQKDDYMTVLALASGAFSGNITEDKRKAGEVGCYWAQNITIPITQRFYNELGENTSTIFEGFKGFNFYYRPIDIENPFPNGLTNTSIWYDWNESDVKNPNLTESYNGDPTYVAYTSGNESSIRKYNNERESEAEDSRRVNEYTNWDKMYLNGVSKYIETEGIIQRNVARDSFYNLGCGPKNTKVNNAFQQTECDTK